MENKLTSRTLLETAWSFFVFGSVKSNLILLQIELTRIVIRTSLGKYPATEAIPTRFRIKQNDVFLTKCSLYTFHKCKCTILSYTNFQTYKKLKKHLYTYHIDLRVVIVLLMLLYDLYLWEQWVYLCICLCVCIYVHIVIVEPLEHMLHTSWHFSILHTTPKCKDAFLRHPNT